MNMQRESRNSEEYYNNLNLNDEDYVIGIKEINEITIKNINSQKLIENDIQKNTQHIGK